MRDALAHRFDAVLAESLDRFSRDQEDTAGLFKRLTISRRDVEERVLTAVKEKLFSKDLFEDFCREFTKEMNRLRMERRAGLSGAKRELQSVDNGIARLIKAIKDGVPARTIGDELLALERRQLELRSLLKEQAEITPLLHPSLADVYREKVTGLCQALQGEDEGRTQARSSLRTLIDEITLRPEGGQVQILLKGNLAAMLRLADNKKRPSETDDLLDSVQLVAGAGFEPATFGL